MDNIPFSTYRIEDRSYLSFIKREIHNAITHAGFTTMRAGEIDIIVSELASNLIKHAQGGELVYRLNDEQDNNKSFEIFCIDDGPGTNDIARMVKDGASSANTLGQGLGSISRLSDVFQIYSLLNWGTIVYSKSYLIRPSTRIYRGNNQFNCSMLQICMPGEKVCGDGFSVKKKHYETQFFLGDGLGHGINAWEAVQKAIEVFKMCDADDPVEILQFIHHRVKKTRGLVATIAILDHKKHQWKICGVGNIVTRLYHGLESRNYMPHNGIVGLNIPYRMTATEVKEEEYQNIIMCSDGIRSRWELTKYPSILKYDPAILAAAIFKDSGRRNDDMSIMVAKLNA
jgi:anti-sigma regulatory factor (Ser/Thr protein kinase)